MTEEQYQMVLAGAKEARDKGWKISTGMWIAPRKRECCALGGFCITRGLEDDQTADLFACVYLECDYDAVVEFGNGFDSDDDEGWDKGPWWNAGHRMRKELGL